MRLLILLIFFCLSSLQAQITVHYLWGLWDNYPLPLKYQMTIRYNERKLNAPSAVHDKEDIFHYVKKFSDEFDPAFYELFQKIPRKVAQADLGRYIIIYYLGGLYLDLDVHIKNPKEFLADLQYPNGVWLTEFVAPHCYVSPRQEPYGCQIAQYAFFSPEKGNPLLLEIILEAFNRIKILFDECGNNWTDDDILWATGPVVVTTRFHETNEKNYKLLDRGQANAFLRHHCNAGWRDGKDLK